MKKFVSYLLVLTVGFAAGMIACNPFIKKQDERIAILQVRAMTLESLLIESQDRVGELNRLLATPSITPRKISGIHTFTGYHCPPGGNCVIQVNSDPNSPNISGVTGDVTITTGAITNNQPNSPIVVGGTVR